MGLLMLDNINTTNEKSPVRKVVCHTIDVIFRDVCDFETVPTYADTVTSVEKQRC